MKARKREWGRGAPQLMPSLRPAAPVFQERTPGGSPGFWRGWIPLDAPPMHPAPLSVSRWSYGPIVVISALEDAEYPDGQGRGPQWHVSISRNGRRPSVADVRKALRSFRMVGSEEDNHHPGVARHFWLPVDPSHRVDCQCKVDEEIIVEGDGYTWTNPREIGEACRGCEYAAKWGKTCPLHGAGASP